MSNNFKMIHIRNPQNKGVISFRTKVDFQQNVIIWDMVVCSKKDTFIKSKSIELCTSSPLKSGVVLFSSIIKKLLRCESFGGCNGIHVYFEQLVIHDAMNSAVLVNQEGDVRHQPEWVDISLANFYIGDVYT